MPISFSPPFDLPLPPCPNLPSPLPFPFPWPFPCGGWGGWHGAMVLVCLPLARLLASRHCTFCWSCQRSPWMTCPVWLLRVDRPGDGLLQTSQGPRSVIRSRKPTQKPPYPSRWDTAQYARGPVSPHRIPLSACGARQIARVPSQNGSSSPHSPVLLPCLLVCQPEKRTVAIGGGKRQRRRGRRSGRRWGRQWLWG